MELHDSFWEVQVRIRAPNPRHITINHRTKRFPHLRIEMPRLHSVVGDEGSGENALTFQMDSDGPVPRPTNLRANRCPKAGCESAWR